MDMFIGSDKARKEMEAAKMSDSNSPNESMDISSSDDASQAAKKPERNLPLTIISLIVDSLPFTQEFLKFREVCKEWEEVIGKSKMMNDVAFLVTNEPDSIKAFHTLSPTFKVKYFRFMNLDMEDLLSDPGIFRRFAKFHCSELNSLILYNCNLSMGRYFELIALSPQLEYLVVRDCPSVYQSDLGIFHWGYYYSALKRNVAGLRRLTMIEKEISEKDLLGFTCDMKKLTTLHISVDGILPRMGICNVLRNNFAVLKELVLGGDFFDHTEFFTENVMEMLKEFPELPALTRLRFEKGYYGTEAHATFFKGFLDKTRNVEELTLTNALIRHDLLFHVQHNLTELHLINCQYVEKPFLNPEFKKLTELRIIHGQNYCRLDEIGKEFLLAITCCKMPELEALELSSLPNGEACVKKNLSPRNYPKLKELSLNNIFGIDGQTMRNIATGFPQLVFLSLNGCSDLDDEVFCDSKHEHGKQLKGVFKHLKNLVCLDLSETRIGNRTVFEGITKLKKLERVYLNRTQLDNVGLVELVDILCTNTFSCGSGKLQLVQVEGTKCVLTVEQLVEVRKLAPNLLLNCTLKIDDPDVEEVIIN